MRTKRWLYGLFALLLLSASFAITACGDDDDSGDNASTSGEKTAAIQSNPDNGNTKITVGSKNFNESKILGEIYAQGLKAAGYNISTELNLGDEKIALKAIETGDISGYPEYTGTILGSFIGLPSAKTPKDATAAYSAAKLGMAPKGITVMAPTPFESSNEVGMTQETADKLGNPKTISDLKSKAGDLTLYGTPECRQRQDCLAGLQDVYGLKFKKFVPVDINLRHEVLEKGQADLSIVFTTDPQIARNKEVLLRDDKGMFPPNNSVFIIDTDVYKKAGPDLPKTVARLQKGLTPAVIRELNARADLDKKTPQQVASEYLKETGLVS